MNIPIYDWGRDHWSTFGYIEIRIVDFKGIPDNHHMRCDPKLHPLLAHEGSSGRTYPTRLREGEVPNHDDWSCLEDAEAVGLLINTGTSLNRVYKLTDEGHHVAAALRRHKANGGSFATFTLEASRDA